MINKDKILSYIKERDFVQIAELQTEFGLTYKEAKSFVDGLLFIGTLVFDSGLKYRVNNVAREDEEDEDDEEEDTDDVDLGELFNIDDSHMIVRRRRTFAEMMKEKEKESEKLHEKVLELCERRKRVSAKMISRCCNVSNSVAIDLIYWLEEKNYITLSEDKNLPSSDIPLIYREYFVTGERFKSKDEKDDDYKLDDNEWLVEVFKEYARLKDMGEDVDAFEFIRERMEAKYYLLKNRRDAEKKKEVTTRLASALRQVFNKKREEKGAGERVAQELLKRIILMDIRINKSLALEKAEKFASEAEKAKQAERATICKTLVKKLNAMTDKEFRRLSMKYWLGQN